MIYNAMELKKIRDLQKQYFDGIEISIKNYCFPEELSVVRLFDENDSKGLKGGSGSPDKQIEQINASVRLAVYYYKLLERTNSISNLRFEWNEYTPLKLKNTNNKANVDVKYERGDEVFFVESKYLEPYYSGCEDVKEAYCKIENYYKEVYHPELWVSQFQSLTKGKDGVQKYQYVNATQLYRHLLAINNALQDPKSGLQGKEIILQSVSWQSTPLFEERVGMESKRSLSYLKKRKNIIEEENAKLTEEMQSFIKSLGWKNCRFETLHYNDILDVIAEDIDFEPFKKQYFL